MSQVFGPRFTLGNRTLLLDYRWLGTAVALAAVSGWFLPEILSTPPTVIRRIIGVILVPISLGTGWLLLEFGRQWLTRAGRTTTETRKLYPLGSIATGYRLPDTPGDELQSEAMTPVVSGISAATFLGLAYVLPDDSIAHFVLIAVGGTHLALAFLSLLPALPMAGGNAFRAVFWFLHGKHTSGTRAAFLYGQFVASAALGFGVYFLTWRTAALIPGLWCLFLGWIVIRASREELQRATIIERAETVCAADAIEGLNPTIRAAAPLTEAIDILMEQRSNGPGLVRDRNEYAGMLNLEKVRTIPRIEWSSLTAGDATIGFSELIDSEPGTDLLDVLTTLGRIGSGTIVVRHHNGRISGLIDEKMDHRLLLRRGLMRNVDPHRDQRTSRQSR